MKEKPNPLIRSLMPFFNPYRIIYLVKDKTVFIIAVFDGRREIDDILYDRITV